MKVLPIISGLLLMTACSKLDRVEPTPSYIYVDKFTFTTDVGVEGEDTENITDAWVYLDNQLLGVFELPARIPVLSEGNHILELRPGIQQNGIASTRQAYPFYEPYEVLVDLHRDSIITIQPSTNYLSNVVFDPAPEDFEGAGQKLIKDPDSDVGWVIESGGITGKYGKIVLNPGQNLGYFHTDDNHSFPKGGAKAYLEMDVKSNNSIKFGVIDEGANPRLAYSIYVIAPTDQSGTPVWKKVYMNLTDVFSFESFSTQNELFIIVQPDDPDATVEVCIDNVKVVYF